MWGFPVLSLLGAGLMLAVIVTTYFTDVFHMTALVGVPALLVLAAVYQLWYRKRVPVAQR